MARRGNRRVMDDLSQPDMDAVEAIMVEQWA